MEKQQTRSSIMKAPQIIIVSGMPGTGTSTLSKALAHHFNYEYIYLGGIFREMAAQRDETIEEFYSYIAANPEREKNVDKHLEDIISSRGNIIAEGRMAPFMKCAFPHHTILLEVEENVRIARLKKRPENEKFSCLEIQQRGQKRLKEEYERYSNLYGVTDHFDSQNFNIVIDATIPTAAEVFDLVLQQIKETEPFPPSTASLFTTA